MTDTQDPIARATALLLGRMRLLITVGVGVGIVTTAVLLLVPNRYTATIGFAPETKLPASFGQIEALAALAGANIGATPSRESPQFYVAVLKSWPVRFALLRQRFPRPDVTGARSDSASLIEILGIDGASSNDSLWRGARRLRQMTSTAVDLRTGIVRVSVTHRSPTLAAAIANAYAEQLGYFNSSTRRTQARARREFISGRVREVEAALRAAEDNARRFLESNRNISNSPQLTYEYNRLQRALSVQQELYLTLQRQLDAARIAEVDDTPTLTIIESAIPPTQKSSPNRKAWLLLVLLASETMIAVLILVRARLEASASPVAGYIRRYMPRAGPWLP